MSFTFKDLHWAGKIDVQYYLQPKTLEEALQILSDHKGRAKVIAGGTDVIPQLRSRDMEVDALVDITRLPEMGRIDQEGEKIILGGLVTHAQVASSHLIKEKAGLLADGAARVGSPQIRNIATVAGNLVSGQPAADTSIPLLALNAQVTIASKSGDRTIPLTEFFLEIGKTALDPSKEILTQIQFTALGQNQGGAYLRLTKRKALALPMLVCSSVVKVEPGKRLIEDASIALGPVAPTPFRASQAEAKLRNSPITREVLNAASDVSMVECTPRDSLLRGSCEYREEMVKVFVRRSLERALAQAGFPIN
ncbi:MAG: FAD binding domain-containing protein [Deltaproteobacteria bacterium]|nr:FAD binding domain-containing protein [Deltaproteobacteria bacterium]